MRKENSSKKIGLLAIQVLIFNMINSTAYRKRLTENKVFCLEAQWIIANMFLWVTDEVTIQDLNRHYAHFADRIKSLENEIVQGI